MIVCDEYEQAGMIRARHRDNYTLHLDTYILEETIIQGEFEGGIKLTLTSVPEGTTIHVDADVSPRNAWIRFLSAIAGGGTLLTKFWVDLFAQVAAVAESPCSSVEPMYCPSRMLDIYFEMPSLPMQALGNVALPTSAAPGGIAPPFGKAVCVSTSTIRFRSASLWALVNLCPASASSVPM